MKLINVNPRPINFSINYSTSDASVLQLIADGLHETATCFVYGRRRPAVRARSHVQQQHPRVLHHRFDLPEESDRLSAVNQTVVVRQSHVHHGPDFNLSK